MLRFALKNMAIKKLRMALVALSVIISASVALLSYNVSAQINDGILNTFIYYDMIIGPAGSSTQLAMNTMFFTDKPLGTISIDIAEELENSGLVNRVVPFCMGDSFNSARIVGTVPELLEGKLLARGELFETDVPYGAVIGSEVASKYRLNVGDNIISSHGLTSTGHAHAGNPLTVVGVLETTHTNYDNTIFTSYKTVWALHGSEEEEEEEEHATKAQSHTGAASHGQGTLVNKSSQSADDEEIEAHEGLMCALLIKSKSPAAYGELTNRYSKDANLLVINPSSVLREVINQVDTSTKIVYLLCAIILVMNILVVSVITLLNLFDSRRDIALMRVIGISMRRIRELYLIQNGLLGLISTLLSLLLCHLSLGFINSYTAAMGVVMNPVKIYPAEFAIAALVFLISVLPTLVCIWAMSRRDALEK